MKQKFKIVVFAHDASLYGASKSLLTLLEYWQKKQTNIELLVLLPYKGTMEEKLSNLEISHKVIDFPRVDYKYDNQTGLDNFKMKLKLFIRERRAIKLISGIIDDFSPNIIYTNTSVVEIGYKISRKLKIPFIWHIREFGWEDYKLKYIPSFKLHQEKISNSNTIFVSKILQNYWLGNERNIKSEVIYNGFVDEKLKQNDREFNNRQNIIIGILGAVMPGKGQHKAIQAVQILNEKGINVKLEIYGHPFDINYYNKLRNLVESNPKFNQYIKFCGFKDNPKEIFERISIMLNCSKSEGFGRTIVEAMLEKIPVVANSAGAIPEIIKDGYNGLLYDQTSKSLSEKLELLINNKTLWKNLTDNAFNFATENYTIKKYGDSVLEFIKKVSDIK